MTALSSDVFSIAVAIISSRETPEVLSDAVRAAKLGLASHDGILDVVINGNRALADALSGRAHASEFTTGATRIRIWYLPLGDKAHAWNTYVHHIWPDSRTTVFVDGYVEVEPVAFGLIDRALAASPGVFAATGVPSTGSSASRIRREMINEGGIHGNLCALNADAMRAIRELKFRLPLGLYRVDAMLGSAVCYRFDSRANAWDPRQVCVVPEASWSFNSLKWWRPGDIVKHMRRVLRQGQGRLENRAFRSYFRDEKRALKDLPDTALEMVEQWIIRRPAEAEGLMKSRLFVRGALKRMRKPQDWSLAVEPPRCLFDSNTVMCNENNE